MARFVQYIPTCLAVLVLRRRDRRQKSSAPARMRLPLGPLIPLISIALCIWLLTQVDRWELAAGAGAFVLGVPFYFCFRRAPSNGPGPNDV